MLVLALACAPHISSQTTLKIIAVESGSNPLALNVNRLARQPAQPKTIADAAQTAGRFIALGYSVDLGLMQINSRNLRSLGLTVTEVLDPCRNLQAGAAILTANYAAASARYGSGQPALQAALSAYNTGSLKRGFANGYVGRYYAAARHRPPIRRPMATDRYSADMAVAWDN